MRIDIFLKKTLLVKKRSLAKGLCDKGFIFIDGKKAKPSTEVKIGSTILISSNKRREIEVLEIPRENVKREEVTRFYRIIKEE
jgi:ribosomal 50S subunit-recycling heat shock protein